MHQESGEHQPISISRRWFLIGLMAAVLCAAVAVGGVAGYFAAEGHVPGFLFALLLALFVPGISVLLYRKIIYPYYRQLEDANLELHIRQEELLDTKDDLFIKFLGIYDVNYAANSPRLFSQRLSDVADITARVMEADRCFVFLYEKLTDDLVLVAANEGMPADPNTVRIPLGEGIEGWVGRKLEPAILKDMRRDSRFREVSGIDLSGLQSVYSLPLYVYSNGSLVGIIEVYYAKARTFRDEQINFFTTLSGILSTTIQNEQMQSELRKMNMELEQWVTEKTEELRASEERYRTLVENACESIIVLAENGDIVFANDQAARLSGFPKYDLIRKNLFDLYVPVQERSAILASVGSGKRVQSHGDLRKADGTSIPVDMLSVGLTLMGRRFLQCVVRDITFQTRLEQMLDDRDREIAALKERLQS